MGFAEEVLAKVPEAQRAAVESLLTEQPELNQALDGLLNAQKSEFSRAMDAVRATETKQVQWWEANRPLVDLGRKAQEAGFDPTKTPASPATPPATNVVSREDFEEAQRQHVQFAAVMSTMQVKHLQEFGEVLDVNKLLNDPNVRTVGLERAYDASVAERRAAKQKEATEAEIARRVNEGIAEAKKSFGHPSFPNPTAVDTSPLAALTPAAGEKNPGLVDKAVDAYHAIVAGAR